MHSLSKIYYLEVYYVAVTCLSLPPSVKISTDVRSNQANNPTKDFQIMRALTIKDKHDCYREGLLCNFYTLY